MGLKNSKLHNNITADVMGAPAFKVMAAGGGMMRRNERASESIEHGPNDILV